MRLYIFFLFTCLFKGYLPLLCLISSPTDPAVASGPHHWGMMTADWSLLSKDFSWIHRDKSLNPSKNGSITVFPWKKINSNEIASLKHELLWGIYINLWYSSRNLWYHELSRVNEIPGRLSVRPKDGARKHLNCAHGRMESGPTEGL